MPKIFSILLLLFTFRCSVVRVKAQDQHIIDSLQGEITKYDAAKGTTSASLVDSTKANLLYQISKLYWDSNPDKAMVFANECLELSEKIGYKKGVLNGNESKGVVNEVKGNYREALIFYQLALKIAKESGNKKGIASTYCDIGNVYYYQGNSTEAIKQYFTALKIYEELKDKKNIATQYSNIGSLYIQLKNYEEALRNLSESLKLRKSLGNGYDLADTYINTHLSL